MTTLAHLSIQHCRRGQNPSAPSNEERYRALQAVLPVPLGNKWFHFARPAPRASDASAVAEALPAA